MAHDVFISYSTHDKLTADAMCTIFETRGIRCWIAPRDILPGADWGESIIDAIAGSRVLVLILSANSNASEQVRREVERAVHKAIVIIPFRIEDVQLSKTLEYHLSVTHWMDALTPPIENHIQLLVEKIKPLLPAPQPEPAAQKQPEIVQAAVSPEKQAENVQNHKGTAKNRHQAIEHYFYDLAKQNRIEKDILLAVLALLDKSQTQLSLLEKQQYGLIEDVFENRLDTLAFVRNWDKLIFAAQKPPAIQETAPEAKTYAEKPTHPKLESEQLIPQQKQPQNPNTLPMKIGVGVLLLIVLATGIYWQLSSEEAKPEPNQAELSNQQENQAAIEVKQKQIALEAERKRPQELKKQAALEADRKRQAEIEAEQQRIAEAKAKQQAEAEAMFLKGIGYAKGEIGDKKDFSLACQWFKKAASAGYTKADEFVKSKKCRSLK